MNREAETPAAGFSHPRIRSIDALRGFDMFWIVGAGTLAASLSEVSHTGFFRLLKEQLEHSAWEGFTFCDLIFPLFIFLAGVSVVFSIGRALESGDRARAVRRIVRRSIVLFALGIFYYGGFAQPLEKIRLLGVLQRIALCYFAAAMLFTFFKPRVLAGICLGLLVLYWALMTFVPVPGVGAGCFDQGKNLANYLDSRYLPLRKWDGTWDPEGLLSTLPAVSTCLLGVFAGLFLTRRDLTEGRKALTFLGVGPVLVVLGFLWGLQFPVIKKIWTSSYVLVAGGYSLILLGLFHLIVEAWGYRKWCEPFVWIGMNSITIYMADNLVDFLGIARRFAGGDIQKALGPAGKPVVAAVSLGLVFLLARFLYKRKIFIRA